MKGQTFEVFRLLIAAVVAGAILMLLLSIMGSLTTPTQNPQQAAASLVKNLSRYGGTDYSEEITFKPGATISLPAVANEAALSEECVDGAVDPSAGKWFKKEGDKLKHVGTAPHKARIKVECEPGTTAECPIECHITITRKID